MNELTKEQIEEITKVLNRIHGDMETYRKNGDPERFSRACGKSIGADHILDIIGYEAVFDYNEDRLLLRRRPDGK